jgi:hypothetical protein
MPLKHESITQIATIGRAELHEKTVAFAFQAENHKQVLEKLRL